MTTANVDAMHTKDVRGLLQNYYSNNAVRARMVEFLGGTFLEQATCKYILGFDSWPNSPPVLSPDRLPWCLQWGLDISRSLWDSSGLVVHLDMEYVNFDYPGEPYLDPHYMFRMQRPTVQVLQRELLRWGIQPLHILTGRGHHFAWFVAQDTPAFEQLAEIGHVPATLQAAYRCGHPPGGEPVDERHGRAHAGLGLVMEYLGHVVAQHAARESPIPVQITDVHVGNNGNGGRGREIVSIDISEYMDPLHRRHIRLPFSAYLKAQRNRNVVGPHVVDCMPLIFHIPQFEMSEAEAVDVMRDPERAAELASRASVRIPHQSVSTENLIREYRASSLADFHQWFYASEPDPPEQWPATYDRFSLAALPSCVRHILEQPNDLLLRPAGIQHVVRTLMALGWHPRHITGLIRSKYERDFGWGKRWYIYDAMYRADGYTRLFAGLIATARDSLVDFNCLSNREKGYCFQPECGHDLRDYRELLARVVPN